MRKRRRDVMEKMDWVTRAAGDRQTDGRQAVPSGKAPFDALWEPNFPPSWLGFQVSCKPKGSDAQGKGEQ